MADICEGIGLARLFVAGVQDQLMVVCMYEHITLYQVCLASRSPASAER